MLKSISWIQFGVFIGVVTAIYYAYVGWRFYRGDLLGKGRARLPQAKAAAGVGADGGANRAGGLTGAGDSTGDQEARVDGQGQMLLLVEEEGELFAVRDKAISRLKGVIAKAVGDPGDRGNLLDHIREVLSEYGQLRGTPYQDSINTFLVRSCAGNFSLVLDGDQLAGLWQ